MKIKGCKFKETIQKKTIRAEINFRKHRSQRKKAKSWLFKTTNKPQIRLK